MGFGKGNDAARLEVDDGDVHVMGKVGGIDEARGGPGAVGAGHDDGLHVALAGNEGLGSGKARCRFIGLADPVEAGRCGTAIADAPGKARRDIGKQPGTHVVAGASNGQREGAIDHEQRGFCLGVRFWGGAAAAFRNFHNVLREGFGKAGHGPCKNPGARLRPARKIAGDDVLHHAPGDHRIGGGEDGAAGQQVRLRRKPACWRVIFRFGHWSSFIQPRPSAVPARGRYSQPTQP